jgi:hypothetical protein
MRKTTTLLLACCCAAFASCASTGSKGNEYRYPERRASATKTVRFASTDGRFVGLSDGSLWNVDWSAAGAAKAFRSGDAVRVENTGSGSFPYRLTTESGRSVAARYGKKLD